MSCTVAVARSTIAIAFASCNVTQAVRPLSVMYSGSRSCAAVAPGPKTRTPSARSASLENARKSAVRTEAFATPWARSMMLIDPSGLTRVRLSVRIRLAFVGDEHAHTVVVERQHVGQRADRDRPAHGQRRRVDEHHFARIGLRARLHRDRDQPVVHVDAVEPRAIPVQRDLVDEHGRAGVGEVEHDQVVVGRIDRERSPRPGVVRDDFGAGGADGVRADAGQVLQRNVEGRRRRMGRRCGEQRRHRGRKDFLHGESLLFESPRGCRAHVAD